MTTTPPDEPVQAGSASYPSYPAEPVQAGSASHPSRPGGVAQPSSVRLAVRLMWAGAALTVLSLVVTLASLGAAKEDIEERLRRDDPSVSQSTIDAAFAIGVGSALIVSVIGVGTWLWMAWKNGQGRSWARVVATVLAGFNVLFAPLVFVQDTPSVSRVFSIVNVVLAIVILVLIWRKDATEFYADRSRPRLG
jgi:tryptophan-rich sensory protein